MKVKYCTTCGSSDIVADAWVSWDEDKQEWVVYNVFDDYYCNSCESECSITDEELNDRKL